MISGQHRRSRKAVRNLTHMVIDQQNVYWIFSSSAQSVSAFIAFLLTGYAFVHAVMEGVQQRDDSLIEVHHALRQQYYSRVRWLSLITGAAIVASLMMVYLNGVSVPWKPGLAVITAGLNLLAIVGGLLFVLSIIDPDKYKKTAAKLVAEEKPPTRLGPTVTDAAFFDEFVRLERLIRSVIEDRQIVTRPDRRVASFRDMIESLYRHEVIPRDLYNKLLETSKFRNLVFHGQVHQVDEAMVDHLRLVREQLERLFRRGQY